MDFTPPTDTVKVLITGNGFDIEHELPTKYTDFLKFMEETKSKIDAEKQYAPFFNTYIGQVKNFDYHTTEQVLANKRDYLAGKPKGLILLEKASCAFEKVVNEMDRFPNFMDRSKILSEILNDDDRSIEYNAILAHTVFTGNLWLSYLQDKWKENTIRGENWVDFEYEISQVIKKIELALTQGQESAPGWKMTSIKDIMGDRICHPDDLLGVNGIIKQLEEDLKFLVGSLEVYLAFVEQLPVMKQQPDIKAISSLDYLITFNYIDTYKKVYESTMHDEYTEMIHGKVGNHNLILGINDNLPKNRWDEELSCIEFKKYFQRIFYRTGLSYKKWFEQNQSNTRQIMVYVFGHSLDITDGEILKYIFLNKNVMQTVIFYHNEESHRRQIANLVHIIGRDEVIERTGRENIIFRQQNESIIMPIHHS